MNKMKMLSVILALFLMGCEKYESGGLISKTEKNIVRTWTLQKYLRNNTDVTSTILISNYEETYTPNNTYLRTYVNKNKTNISESGVWKLETEERAIQIDGVSSIDITTQTGTISASKRTITKLTDSVFWYTFVNGRDKHEFRLVRK